MLASSPRLALLFLLLSGSTSLATSTGPDAFEAYLRPPHPPAEGFAVPPDLSRARGGTPVSALARGRVVEAEAGRVVVEHLYYENHALLRARTAYAGLEAVEVRAGARVERGQVLGRVGRTGKSSLVLRADRDLSQAEAVRFASERAKLLLPAEEATLVLVSHAHHQLRLYERGRERLRLEVGFGQAPGAKVERGDNRTPVGMYFVTQKARGEMPGPYGAYYGGHWMRLNYPNAWDARRGVARGWLDERARARITTAWTARKDTDASTRLGSGIGFHGWAHEWELAETAGRMSWGCIVLHLRDLTAFYARLSPGAMVVLF
ncbi:L,D-transpeptidase family protein [Myxococcus sp. K15C18031901]|uniref:L,D-transpeptidase family protein n=1 Tax=Myxococcus dinghuensis TaxID=2906761 RepID=UPI0020A70004|nr:L,D-transpeptidase family protein [Myxococcus dinghuensis]MCP3102351.1 L,D-transpeptidase family protein [Myxococcus dinghuensis]